MYKDQWHIWALASGVGGGGPTAHIHVTYVAYKCDDPLSKDAVGGGGGQLSLPPPPYMYVSDTMFQVLKNMHKKKFFNLLLPLPAVVDEIRNEEREEDDEGYGADDDGDDVRR